MIHHTRIEDAFFDIRVPFGPGKLITRFPLLDRAHKLPSGEHLFARLTYRELLEVAEREGARLITSAEVDELRACGLQLKPYLGTPRAENGIEHSIAHDTNVRAQLAALNWSGEQPVAGAGKHWIAGAPAGRSRLKGWDKDGAGPGLEWWQPDQVAHNREHFDDGTTSMLVWDVVDGMLAPPDDSFRPAVRTPAAPRDVLEAIRRAWPDGSRESCLVLLAQWGIETGDGASCWNHNLGNVKRVKGQAWTMLGNVWEILDGKKVVFQPPHPQTHFCAFDSLDDGAAFYVEKLRTRFAKAWPAVLSGDPATFSRTLKSLRYYTAPEQAYTAAVVARFRQFEAQTRANAGRDAVAAIAAVAGSIKAAVVSAAGQVADALDGMGADRDVKPVNVYLSHGYRCAVAELVADARKTKRWHDVSEVRAKSASPKVGDLVISRRSGEDPRNGGKGHVERVTGFYPDHWMTIGGNESNTWIEAPFNPQDAALVGFIDVCGEIGTRAIDLSRGELEDGVAEKAGPSAHPRIQAYHAGARRGGTALAGMPGRESDGASTLGSKASDEVAWCASAASWAAHAAALELNSAQS